LSPTFPVLFVFTLQSLRLATNTAETLKVWVLTRY